MKYLHFKKYKKLYIILILLIVLIVLIYYNFNNYIEYNKVFLYWEGDISQKRLDILKMTIQSINYFNKDKDIYLYTNSLYNDDRLNSIKNICNITKYTYDDLVKDTLLEDNIKVKNIYEKEINNGRVFCDFFRYVILYKYGGTYTDTDNVCFRKFKKMNNIICRTYDPHTAVYDRIPDDECIPGKYKYNQKYTNIPFAIRTDCWINMIPKNNYLKLILSSEELYKHNKPLYINEDTGSWQGLILRTAYNNIDVVSKENIFGLTLIYFYETFIANSSEWDKCTKGGEMCELYDKLPNIKEHNWGQYNTDKLTSINLLNKIKDIFPTSCFIWYGDKDSNEELFNTNNKDTDKLRITSWIWFYLKEKMIN